jgi:hypothetical protein
MPKDLFAPATEEEAMKRALCGFLPMGGWPHKWAHDAHIDNCQDCRDMRAQIEEEKDGGFEQ